MKRAGRTRVYAVMRLRQVTRQPTPRSTNNIAIVCTSVCKSCNALGESNSQVTCSGSQFGKGFLDRYKRGNTLQMRVYVIGVYTFICACAYVHIYGWMDVCMYDVCMYVCMRMYLNYTHSLERSKPKTQTESVQKLYKHMYILYIKICAYNVTDIKLYKRMILSLAYLKERGHAVGIVVRQCYIHGGNAAAFTKAMKLHMPVHWPQHRGRKKSSECKK